MQQNKSFVCSSLLSKYNIEHGFFFGYINLDGDDRYPLNLNIKLQNNAPDIDLNKAFVSSCFDLSKECLKLSHQVHSSDTLIVKDRAINTEQTNVDALISDLDGVLLGALSADCTPILLYDIKRDIFASLHAGHKGAYLGIIQSAVSAMQSIGSDTKEIIAAIGPCIRQKSYQVGQEFFDKISSDKYFVTETDGYFFDLPLYCYDILKSLNLHAIDDIGLDTYPEHNKFFSYRRNTHSGKKTCYCQVSVIKKRKVQK